MREIKFRAKRIDNGEWVYGFYCEKFVLLSNPREQPFCSITQDGPFILQPTICDRYEEWAVDRNTIFQFTGLYDKNGKEIYEGDVVDGYSGKYQLIFVQVTGTGYFFYWKPLEQCTESMTGFIDEYTVIGNIYENKDLLSN